MTEICLDGRLSQINVIVYMQNLVLYNATFIYSLQIVWSVQRRTIPLLKSYINMLQVILLTLFSLG